MPREAATTARRTHAADVSPVATVLSSEDSATDSVLDSVAAGSSVLDSVADGSSVLDSVADGSAVL